MSDTSTATLLYPTAACALLKFGTVERERDKVEHSGRYDTTVPLLWCILATRKVVRSRDVRMRALLAS